MILLINKTKKFGKINQKVCLFVLRFPLQGICVVTTEKFKNANKSN